MIYDVLLYSMANEAGMEGIPMRKMICDRCGEEIDTSFMDKYDMHPKAFCRIFGKNSRGTGGLVECCDDLEYELCENCANELVIFLKG